MRRPEDVKAELVQQWLDKAESDLGVADHLLSASTPYVEAIGFHAQQALACARTTSTSARHSRTSRK